MKQKIIIKVQIACHKCRTKALKIAAGASGVISVAAQGDESIVVTGRCVDPVELTATLRKKVGVAILLSVEEIKDPPPPKKADQQSPPPPAKTEKPAPPPGDKNNKGGGEEKGQKPSPPAPPGYPYGMPPVPCQPSNYYYPQQPQYCMYEIPPSDPTCSIM